MSSSRPREHHDDDDDDDDVGTEVDMCEMA